MPLQVLAVVPSSHCKSSEWNRNAATSGFDPAAQNPDESKPAKKSATVWMQIP